MLRWLARPSKILTATPKILFCYTSKPQAGQKLYNTFPETLVPLILFHLHRCLSSVFFQSLQYKLPYAGNLYAMTSLEKTIVLGRGSVRIILSKTYLQFIFRRGGQGRGRCEKGRFRSMYAVKEGEAEYRSFTNFHNAQGVLSWNILETSQYSCTVLYRVGQEWSFCNMSICTRSSLQSPSSKNQTKLHSFLHLFNHISLLMRPMRSFLSWLHGRHQQQEGGIGDSNAKTII